MNPEKVWYLKSGDEIFTSSLVKLKLFDRGRGPYDHHGKNIKETSATLIAKHLGIAEKEAIKQLLFVIKQSDLQGISDPFSLPDIIKCIQRYQGLNDAEKMSLGIKIVASAVSFREKFLQEKIQRDNSWVKKLFEDFLSNKEVVGSVFQKYLQQLFKPRFERPFDIVEILVAEREKGEKEAKIFATELFSIIYHDKVIEFLKGLKDAKEALWIRIKGIPIAVGTSTCTKFNVGARILGAQIIIQRNPKTRQTQIFFNIKQISDHLVEIMISMIRLEELLKQGRKIPDVDFRVPEKIAAVPEWYYYKSQKIGRKKTGKFLLSGSLTAPDNPKTKLNLGNLLYIANCAVRFYPKFNWAKWKTQRIKVYQKTGVT